MSEQGFRNRDTEGDTANPLAPDVPEAAAADDDPMPDSTGIVATAGGEGSGASKGPGGLGTGTLDGDITDKVRDASS